MTFVVGIDGSDISWAAFHAACRMIDRKKDTMWAYHVTNPGRYKDMPLNYQPDTLKNNFESLSIREEVSDCVNVNWMCEEKASVDSKVRDMICSFAHKKTADVLILGAYGTKGKQTWSGKSTGDRDKLGSAAYNAVHTSFCTCVIIKNDNGIAVNTEAAAKQHLKYMACVDGSDLAHDGYKVAAGLARRDFDPVVACTLETPQSINHIPHCFRPDIIVERYTEANQMYVTPGMGEVLAIQRNRMSVPKQLCDVADTSGAVFIAFGSQGLSGGKAAMGSVANYALKKGHCCVIIVKANEHGCKQLFVNDPEEL